VESGQFHAEESTFSSLATGITRKDFRILIENFLLILFWFSSAGTSSCCWSCGYILNLSQVRICCVLGMHLAVEIT
jgi:hypothetical protein